MKGTTRREFVRIVSGAGLAITGLSTASNAKTTITLNKENLRFVFQGDSITDGNRGRNDDPNHILGHGYCFAISSRVGADFPSHGFQFFNRGISGNTIADLEKRWQPDMLELKPDVVSVLIGINDVNALVEGKPDAMDATAFEKTYRKILAACQQQNPDVLIVLGLPFFVASGWRKDQYQKWHPLTVERADVVRRIATDVNAVVVDYPEVFAEAQQRAPMDYWIWDGIHPTAFGHELMAREWIKQVSNRLEFLKRYLK